MRTDECPTLVVFTFGRPDAVRRLARYYREYPGRIVVVDGSPAPVDSPGLPEGSEYLHRPGMSVYGRIAEGIARVASPTCALAADDDYHLETGLRACVDALDAHPEVACAAGTVVHFDRASGCLAADDAVERILALPGSPDPAQRFADAISTGPQVFYACYRTSVARRVSEALRAIPDGGGLAGEQLWTSLPALFGRITMVPRLQICRRIAHRDYSGYLAPFRSLDDICQWEDFDRMAGEVGRLAADAGLDPAGASRVIERWRAFAAQTARGRRSWKARRHPASVRSQRIARNVLASIGVAIDPRAWTDPTARVAARNRASRLVLSQSAYPWSDPVARAEFERVMAFDAQAAARA